MNIRYAVRVHKIGGRPQTRFSRALADQIIRRIDEQLALLPQVIEQAHERIIGGRLVKNHKKILSVYERDIAVIVRGKAGAQTEFGNELFMAESPGAMIIDYMLYGKTAPWEGDKLIESVQRQQSLKRQQDLEWAVADRGFDGAATRKALQAAGVSSHICPKSPVALEARLKEPDFCRWQTRRAGTEARIAIVKNHGGGRVWRAKGLKHRRLAVGWSVLAHNLAWISRKGWPKGSVQLFMIFGKVDAIRSVLLMVPAKSGETETAFDNLEGPKWGRTKLFSVLGNCL